MQLRAGHKNKLHHGENSMVRVRAKDDGDEEDRAIPVGSEGGTHVLGWGASVTCGLQGPAELLKCC